MKINTYIGKYISINVASSKNKVANASGGAVATTLLINALKKKKIDAAIIVSMNSKKPYLHEVKTATNIKQITKAAGSKYVLINFNEFLKKINENKDKKLAVTALPCHTRIIRKLQQQGKLKNIKIIIGLFCGYNMPIDATLFLLKKMNIKLEDIKELNYRGGKYPGGFQVKLKNNRTIFLPKYYYDFLNLMFVPKGCLSCTDFTNELADVSIGDCQGYNNSSVMIVRNKLINSFCNDLNIKEITEKEFFKMHWHNVKHKKIKDQLTLKMIRILVRRLRYVLPFHLLAKIAMMRRILKKQKI